MGHNSDRADVIAAVIVTTVTGWFIDWCTVYMLYAVSVSVCVYMNG